MNGEHTLTVLRIFERPPIAVLSPGRPMAFVTFLITSTMDMAVLKAEDPSSGESNNLRASRVIALALYEF